MEAVRNFASILKREVKSYFESPVAYVFLVAFLVLVNFLTFFMRGGYYEERQADLRMFFDWHPWVYLFLVPAASMRTWAEERRSGSIELLLTLPVTTTQAVLGKFFGAWLFLGLGLALTFPIVITTAWLGDPDIGPVIGGYAGSFLLAGAYLTVGVFTSSVTRNQVISFVLSVGICLALVLAGLYPITRMLADWSVPGWFIDGLAAFSVLPHYESIQRGVIDLRDVGYFVSVMIVMLFATNLVVRNRNRA